MCQIHGGRELVVADAEIEGKAEARQEANPFDEARLQAESSVGLVLEQAADAAGEVVRGELLEVGVTAAPRSSGARATMALMRGSRAAMPAT